MNVNFRKPTRIFVLIIVVVLGACQAAPQSGNDAGQYPFSEGDTAYANQYRQASDILAQGDYPAAEEMYNQLIEQEPKNYNGYVGLGSSLLLQDRLDEALEAYQQALELKPDSSAALIGLGSTYYKRQAYAEAVNYFTRALEVDRENPNAEWGLGISLHHLGRDAEALPHFQKVLELAPGSTLAAEAEQQIQNLNATP